MSRQCGIGAGHGEHVARRRADHLPVLRPLPSLYGVDYISDCTKSQSNSMTFAVPGIPQHTFREMRFANLLFVAIASHASSRTVRRNSTVVGSYAPRLLISQVYSTSSPPIRQAIMTSHRMYDDRGHKLLQAVRPWSSRVLRMGFNGWHFWKA